MSLLPGEILCNIVQSLNAQDLLQCLAVCQNWYFSLLYQLYQHIHINNDHQAQLFFEALQRDHTLRSSTFRVGSYVKSVSFQSQQKVNLGLGIQLCTVDPVRITQSMLSFIEQSCPSIEYLDFDYSQWTSKKEPLSFPQRLLHSLKRLPSVDFSIYGQAYRHTEYVPDPASGSLTSRRSPFKINSHLTTLHIRNNTDLFEPNTFIDFLTHIPQVQSLTFERDNVFNKYRTPILSLELLKTILLHLPQLKALQFIKHFNFGTELSPASSSSPQQFYYDPEHIFLPVQQQLNPFSDNDHTLCSLQHLKLDGTLRSYHWLSYISQHLRQLRSLDVDVVLSPYSSNPSLSYSSPTMPSTHFLNAVIKESFLRIARQCQQLSRIRIRGISTPLWLSASFVNALRQGQRSESAPSAVTLDAQLYGLDSFGVQDAITTLTYSSTNNNPALMMLTMPTTKDIQLTSLRLPIWKTSHVNSPIKNWTITLAPLMTNFSQTLAHLELDAISISFNSNQQPHSSMNNYSEGNTSSYQTQPFELDTLLNMFVNLVSLKLSGSAVELSQNLALNNDSRKHPKFRELQLFKMLFTTAIVDYLSACCPCTKKVIIYECTHWHNNRKKDVGTLVSNNTARNIGKVPLHLNNLNLDVLVLYGLQHAHHTTVEGHSPGARFLCYTTTTNDTTNVKGSRWFHLAKKQEGGEETPRATATAVLKSLTSTETIQTIVERSYQYVLGLLHGDDNNSHTSASPPSYHRRLEYHLESEWKKDLAFGYIDLQCNSLKKLFMDEASLKM